MSALPSAVDDGQELSRVRALSDEEADQINRLCRLAAAECMKCSMGEEPRNFSGYWRHGHDLCAAAKTHERITDLEREFERAHAVNANPSTKVEESANI